MASPAEANIRSAARGLERSAKALLDALDRWDASDYADEPSDETIHSAAYLDYVGARAHLAAVIGTVAPLADEDDGEDG